MTNDELIDAIDDLLPQTQCGLCGFGGCRPYATAITNGQAEINLCPPGGVATLQSLADLLHHNAEPFMVDMQQKAKPPSLAIIREAECIGCTKCIQACPVDAIVGSAKRMHTVIADECTGCELCLEPCPVDCIDMVVVSPLSEPQRVKKAKQARQRYYSRNQRLAQIKQEEPQNVPFKIENIDTRKTAIQEALARVKAKKNT